MKEEKEGFTKILSLTIFFSGRIDLSGQLGPNLGFHLCPVEYSFSKNPTKFREKSPPAIYDHSGYLIKFLILHNPSGDV